jgi:hypothetical protein
MALSATGRTLRIRRQTYTDSPGGSEDMEDDDFGASKGPTKVRKSVSGGKLAIRLRLDGTADTFTTASVSQVPSDLVATREDGEISSDDEIYKDVRTYVRQTMGKPAALRAEAGICGTGEYATEGGRGTSQWLDGGFAQGNYVTVRHPLPNLPIDVPPLPVEPKTSTKSEIPSWVLVNRKLPLTCRHWFDQRYVADIERAELGTFGVSELLYKDLRDRIINAYFMEPSKFLSVRNAREATGYGETAVLVKIWGFLDYWGIINFYSDPSTAPRFSKKLVDYPIMTRKDVFDEKIVCSNCHKVCTITCYRIKPESAPLVPREQVSLARFCAACFNTGMYPSFFTKDSFEQQDLMLPGSVNSEWTEEETLQLFEGIDRYGLDWDAVAGLIGGGKTAAQCLLHFVQLPMSERFLPITASRDPEVKPNPFRDPDSWLLSLITTMCATIPVDVSRAVSSLAKLSPVKTEDIDMK